MGCGDVDIYRSIWMDRLKKQFLGTGPLIDFLYHVIAVGAIIFVFQFIDLLVRTPHLKDFIP